MELEKKEAHQHHIRVKDIALAESGRAAALLAQNFKDDKGMKALFAGRDAQYEEKLSAWFKATLALQRQNRQTVWGAFKGNSLIGLAMISDTACKASGLSMIRWMISISVGCGFGTLVKTILHDQRRQQHFRKKQQLILEFIAIDSPYQGQGIGRLFMQKLQEQSARLGKPIWLETTKPKNIKIFEKYGFALTYRKVEQGVVYFIMANEQPGTNEQSGTNDPRNNAKKT